MDQRNLIIATCLALCVAVVAQPALAGPASTAKKSGGAPKMYRWVDKEGKVHYGDKIPAEYADQHKQQLSASGQVVKEIEGAMTPEQRAQVEERKRAEEAAKAQTETDRVLLATYGTVADIERSRDARLAALHGQVTMSSSTVASLERDIATLEKQRGAAKDPKAIERIDQQLAARRNELTSNQRHVVTRTQEMKDVEAQYARDIARFRALTDQPAPKPATAPATKR